MIFHLRTIGTLNFFWETTGCSDGAAPFMTKWKAFLSLLPYNLLPTKFCYIEKKVLLIYFDNDDLVFYVTFNII